MHIVVHTRKKNRVIFFGGKKMKKLFILVLLLGVASGAWASTDWYSTATSSDWFTAANWSGGVPVLTPTTNTRTYGTNANPNFMPVISGGAAVAHQLDIGGSSQAGTLQVPPITASVTLNSGSLTVTDYLRAGSSSGSNRWGAFYMNGGTVTVGNYLAVGYGTGTIGVKGWLYMTDGTINITNAFVFGQSAGTSGIAYISGNSTVNAASLNMRPTGTSGTPTTLLDITGHAKVVLNGDARITISGYIGNGWIQSNGVDIDEFVDVTYDAIANKTTIVPEPATLCLLGLGALSLIRRKR